jgi:hypothetical protein
MEIQFLGKEDSNRFSEEEFLALSPSERFMAFLELSRRVNQFFPSRQAIEECTKNKFSMKNKR